MTDDNSLESHLVAVFDELVELVQETRQAQWSAPSTERRHALDPLKAFLVEQATTVSEAEERIGHRSPLITSPSGHRPRNISGEARGDASRLLNLLASDLEAVAEDLRTLRAPVGGEWHDVFSRIAMGLDGHVAALRGDSAKPVNGQEAPHD